MRRWAEGQVLEVGHLRCPGGWRVSLVVRRGDGMVEELLMKPGNAGDVGSAVVDSAKACRESMAEDLEVMAEDLGQLPLDWA